MSRRLRVVLVAAFLSLAAGTGVAYADDCSSPSDCSNTAWTVGGGAAAAAAIVAAAAAAGWLPRPEAETGLSPECMEALTGLSANIRGLYQRMAELIVAQRGAYRSWTAAVNERHLLDAQAEEVLRQAREGNYDYQGAMNGVASSYKAGIDKIAYGNLATGVGTGTAAGELALGRAAAEFARSSLIAQTAQLRRQAQLASTLSEVAGRNSAEALRAANLLSGGGRARGVFAGAVQLEQGQLARLATLEKIRAAELAKQSSRLAERAGQMAATNLDDVGRAAVDAAGKSTMGAVLKGAGRGLGIFSSATGIWGIHRARERNQALQVAGILQFRAGAKAMEVLRWESFRRELAAKEEATRNALAEAMHAYDQRAAVCGAKQLDFAAYEGMLTGFDPSTAQSWGGPGGGPVPASILDPGPQPVKEDEPFEPNCEAYLQNLADYQKELIEVSQLLEERPPTATVIGGGVEATDFAGYAERVADIDATLAQAEVAYDRILTRFQKEFAGETALSTISVGTSIAALFSCITPPVAIALGIASLASGLASSYMATPDEFNTIYVGRMAAALDEMRRKRAYASAEVSRLSEIMRTRIGNLKAMYNQLNATYEVCDGQSWGWSKPESPHDLQPTPPPFAGRVRTLREIELWR